MELSKSDSGLFHESSGSKSLTAVNTGMMEVDHFYLSTNTATPPRGDFVKVSDVLPTGCQCSES